MRAEFGGLDPVGCSIKVWGSGGRLQVSISGSAGGRFDGRSSNVDPVSASGLLSTLRCEGRHIERYRRLDVSKMSKAKQQAYQSSPSHPPQLFNEPNY